MGRERNFDIEYDDGYDSDDYGDGSFIANVYNVNDDDGISNVNNSLILEMSIMFMMFLILSIC